MTADEMNHAAHALYELSVPPTRRALTETVEHAHDLAALVDPTHPGALHALFHMAAELATTLTPTKGRARV